MPGMYEGEDYDLAGFCVGVAEKEDIIDGKKVAGGDVLIALPSSGPHANGFSLIRKIIDVQSAALDTPLSDGQVLVDALLAPTTIYNRALLSLQKAVPIHAMAHITGGGLPENLPRVLPEGCTARIDLASWRQPAVFEWLQQGGRRCSSCGCLSGLDCYHALVWRFVFPQHSAALLFGCAAMTEVFL